MEGKSNIVDATDDDRISKLPEPILHHILSFLDAEDVARMSTLSKVWVSAWNSLPYLNFTYTYYEWNNGSKHMNDVIDHTLANKKKNNVSIQKLYLWLGYHPCLSHVDNWIKLLITCNIKELNLRVDRHIYEYNSLPEIIFAAKSLNVLSLNGFKIELPVDDGMIKLSYLRELHLSNVFFDEQFIQALCTSCCNLEQVYLRNFNGLTSFQVGETSLPKLKMVNLEFCPFKFQLVDIAAINLEDLKISNLFGNINVDRITACKALKCLYLNGVDVTDNWLEELFYSLQNLEKFNLICCKTLRIMKIVSGSLKWLTASHCDNLIAAELDTPNLLKFQYNCHPLSTFKLKASVLLEASFHLYPKSGDSGWHFKLVKFLANFNHSKAIELLCLCDMVIIIPKDLRENLFPPLYGTSNLQVNLQKQWNYSVVDIVDSMLWISPHLDTLSFTQAPGLKTVKFIYEDASDEDEKPCWRHKLNKVKLHNFTCMEQEKLRNNSFYILDEDEKPCCASLPWKCWRHKLNKVKLQNFTCVEQEKLRNYFIANADISEMVEISLDLS